METDLLFAKTEDAAYITEFSAILTYVDRKNNIIRLNKTAFYPTGGGQPHDIGTITVGDSVLKVTKVKKNGLLVDHYIEYLLDQISVGDKIEGKVNWELRYKYQRTHTAMHILCGIIYNEFGSTVTGGQIKELQGRMDFDIESFSKDKIKFIEQKCNEAITNDLPIKVAFLSREEANKDPELIRTKVNLIPEFVKIIRTIDIVGLDKQADGGTHVRSTKEVGKMFITKMDNRGKGRKRLYFSLSD